PYSDTQPHPGTPPRASRGSSPRAAPLALEPLVDDHRAPNEQPAAIPGPPELAADLAAQEPEPPRADPAEQRRGGRADDQHVAKGNEVVSVSHGPPESAPGRRGAEGDPIPAGACSATGKAAP